MHANFGAPARPGSEPPPRQPLTQAEILYRETFTRAGHLAGQPAQAEASGAASASKPSAASVFDETTIRAALRQEGMDFAYQIFPIGERPAEGLPGSNQYRENRITELESERSVMRERMLAAESAAAGAIRELSELRVRFDTLQSELDAAKAVKSENLAQEAV